MKNNDKVVFFARTPGFISPLIKNGVVIQKQYQSLWKKLTFSTPFYYVQEDGIDDSTGLHLVKRTDILAK